MKELFLGTGIAHSILLFAFVIAAGLWLGRFKFKGVTIGSTWILFVGILLSHFGFRSDPTVLAFMKDFGLILFVFSIGLQVGPGFFQSFRKGGLQMNLLAVGCVLFGVLVTCLVHLATGEDMATMVGVMSGAVTNTPGLGAAQETLSDMMQTAGSSHAAASAAASSLASPYAVAYPMGVLGVIFVLILLKAIFRIDLDKEKNELDTAADDSVEKARRMHCEVENPAVFGRSIRDIISEMGDKFVISRVMRDGKIFTPDASTTLQKGDKVLLVTSQAHVDSARIIFGEEIPMHISDWEHLDEALVSRRLAITKSSITGKHLSELGLRTKYGVTVTRIIRAGVELVAHGNLILQMGDSIQVVGTQAGIAAAAQVVGNKPETLRHPNLVPIFLGIVIGIIFGSIPISIPGIPQAIKLGLAGGPLIIAILLGHIGPKWRITTYTTLSANMMIREMGITFFMAAVGLGAGENFLESLTGGGYWWILYGTIITIVPTLLIGLIARLAFKLNFYQLCGLIIGSTTNAPVLSFAQGAYGTDYTSVNYATVYPLSMFMRVLVAQLMILLLV